MRTDTSVEAGGDNTPELRKSPIPNVDADQMGLPMADDAGPVMEKGQSAWVLRVHVHSPGGGQVRSMVETPVVFADASGQGLVEGKMGLDPSDPRKLGTMGHDDSPEVTMWSGRQGRGMQKKLEAVGDIPTVRKDVNAAWGAD